MHLLAHTRARAHINIYSAQHGDDFHITETDGTIFVAYADMLRENRGKIRFFFSANTRVRLMWLVSLEQNDT